MNQTPHSVELHLLPVTLGEEAPTNTLCAQELEVIQSLSLFFVENERSARRFLRKAGYTASFDETEIVRIDKDSKASDIKEAMATLSRKGKAGLLSEAGCPGIADPGSELVQAAHRQGFTVIPYPGPSSIFLTLMASGMNGQQFRFHGYLPIDGVERSKRIRQLEEAVQKTGCTQLFIETPYRNNALLNDLLKVCRDQTRLCIGVNLTLPNASVQTRSIQQWRNKSPDLHKQLVVFALG